MRARLLWCTIFVSQGPIWHPHQVNDFRSLGKVFIAEKPSTCVRPYYRLSGSYSSVTDGLATKRPENVRVERSMQLSRLFFRFKKMQERLLQLCYLRHSQLTRSFTVFPFTQKGV